MSGITKFHDPLIMMNGPNFLTRPNPITKKYYDLTRDLDESGAKDLTPNKEELEIIHELLSEPDFATLSDQSRSIIWHFRYSLASNKRALIKFLRCVDWTKEKEEQEAMSLLKKWVEIDIE